MPNCSVVDERRTRTVHFNSCQFASRKIYAKRCVLVSTVPRPVSVNCKPGTAQILGVPILFGSRRRIESVIQEIDEGLLGHYEQRRLTNRVRAENAPRDLRMPEPIIAATTNDVVGLRLTVYGTCAVVVLGCLALVAVVLR